MQMPAYHSCIRHACSKAGCARAGADIHQQQEANFTATVPRMQLPSPFDSLRVSVAAAARWEVLLSTGTGFTSILNATASSAATICRPCAPCPDTLHEYQLFFLTVLCMTWPGMHRSNLSRHRDFGREALRLRMRSGTHYIVSSCFHEISWRRGRGGLAPGRCIRRGAGILIPSVRALHLLWRIQSND